MANNRFQRGSGAFHCEACGRLTRHTGDQAVGSKLCPQDWELAGIYNEWQDEGDEAVIANRGYIITLCDEIVEKGGELDGDAQELLALARGE